MLSKNEQKYIKSLKIKKYRTREKRFLIEGAKNVLELINSDFGVEMLIGSEDFVNENLGKIKNFRTEIVKKDVLTQLSTFKTNESVLAIGKMKEFMAPKVPMNDHLFVLDGVGDPGNMGTIIRTLDWFGFSELVCSPNCAEFYHPKVIASTMGSFTRVNVYYEDLNSFLSKLDAPVLAADMNGNNLNETSILKPSVIIMGSESHGISQEVNTYITDYITIPKYGQAESLNVGIAAGIISGYLRMSR